MAIETLKGVTEIDGFGVVVMDELKEKYPDKFNESGAMDYKWFEAEIRPKNFIYIRNDVNSISFTIQRGPVKSAGVNGCQLDTMIMACGMMLRGLDAKNPHADNNIALFHLEETLKALKSRKLDRELRGVEGTNRA